MGFQLLGFDFFREDKFFGIWFLSFENWGWEEQTHSFLGLRYDNHFWTIEFLWVSVTF